MEQILNIVRTRLNLTNEQDALITSYVQEIGQRILHFCNIDEIPEALYYVWASMVIDVLRIEQPQLFEQDLNTLNVRIGDTQIMPASPKGMTATSKSVIDSIVYNYRTDLNRYRRLRW